MFLDLLIVLQGVQLGMFCVIALVDLFGVSLRQREPLFVKLCQIVILGIQSFYPVASLLTRFSASHTYYLLDQASEYVYTAVIQRLVMPC